MDDELHPFCKFIMSDSFFIFQGALLILARLAGVEFSAEMNVLAAWTAFVLLSRTIRNA